MTMLIRQMLRLPNSTIDFYKIIWLQIIPKRIGYRYRPRWHNINQLLKKKLFIVRAVSSKKALPGGFYLKQAFYCR